MTSSAAVVCAFVLASSPEGQHAAAKAEERDGPFSLRYHSFGDPALAAFLSAAWIATELGKNVLAPSGCRLCDRDPDGVDRLNRFDSWGRGARWPTLNAQHTADTLSNIISGAVIPATLVGLDIALARAAGRDQHAAEDLVLVAKTAAAALLLNQTVKFWAARERPFVHVLTPEERLDVDDPLDKNLSFFSGHATFAFTTVVAAGTLAELRSYRGRALIWIVGLPLAASVAYLRMAADKHYLSDVLVGAAVGTAFGVGIPLLLHPREERAGTVQVRLLPSPRGVSLFARF